MERPVHLEIQFQQDQESTTACVTCPLVEKLNPITDCQKCPHCSGLEVDPVVGKASILCRRAAQPTPAPPAQSEGRFSPSAFAAKTPISALMSKSVICIPADTSLPDVASLFLAEGLSGAPVIDRNQKPIGMVSKTDLVRASFQQEGTSLPPTSAWEVMNPIVTVLHDDTSVARASALFASEGLHRVPVVDEQGKVIGLLSALDILRWLAVFSGESA